MRRRQFIALLGAAAAAGPMARAQQSVRHMRRAGAGSRRTDPINPTKANAAFEQGLAQRGWTSGRNVRIDYRWAVHSADKTKAAIAELQARPPDLIVAATSGTVVALQKAMPTVPIVFATIYEPVAQGFVQSLAHPGGNATGFTMPPATIGGNGWSCFADGASGHPRRLHVQPQQSTARYSPMRPSRRRRAAIPLPSR